MKKTLLKLSCFVALATCTLQVTAQRFLTEVFPSVSVTTNVTYASNYSVFPPAPQPTLIDLKLDVYEPAGAVDPLLQRPLICFFHTGSYLPIIVNNNATGSRNDSATVEICKQFARRGYVVANVDYRLGWDPLNSSLDGRRGTLLNAVYRSIQDAKCAVRFFRADAAGANVYKIDPNNIIIGGQGTGGYIAMNYAVLDDPAEITLPKFISNTTIPSLGLVAGQPYVNQAALGDFDGFGGFAPFNNPNNSPGFSSAVQFVFNMGGSMGDSSWIEAGDEPMVALHCVDDPFAPYGVGIVYVPTTPPQSVVDVIGSSEIIKWANAYNNNACFNPNNFTDVYTVRANSINGGQEGLFPLIQTPSPYGHAGPWEWYDQVATQNLAVAFGYTTGYGDTCYMNSLVTNPGMSKAKALAYIDTLMGYLNPRVVLCLGLPTGINAVETNSSAIHIYNSAMNNYFTVSSSHNQPMRKIEVIDMKGRVVTAINNPSAFEQRVTKRLITANKGVMFVRISYDNDVVTKKLLLE